MRRSRGRLTLGVHKIPFLEFSPSSSFCSCSCSAALAGCGEPAAAWNDKRESPREILDRRYASGEITKEQYEEMRRALER